jgi:tRNA(Ile)-lysidine synthase
MRFDFDARRYNRTVLERAVAAITRYNMFARTARVGVAVSGGADSMCLLHLLHQLAPEWELALTVLHLNHGLRGEESRGDAEFVREQARSLGLPVIVREVKLPADGNLEQAAREARLELFQAAVLEARLDCVATGHTRSDQAETVLFRFLRGSGTAGLAGIRPATDSKSGSARVVRPLLELSRAEIELYLRSGNIEWREDSSNSTLQFARNRIRSHLMPQLEREWNPAIRETLAQTAEWARAEEAYWEAEIDRLAVDRLSSSGGFVFMDAAALVKLPLAVARRLARRAIERAKGDLRGIDFGHVEAILALAAGGEGHGRVQAPGLDVLRSFEWLRFGPLGSYGLIDRAYSVEASIPGVVRAEAVGVEISLELIEKPETFDSSSYVYNSKVGCLDWGSLSGRMVLRNWRPGDQYQPIGRSREEKIKTLFQEFRIPIWERRHWPVLTDGGSIVWARRFGPAANRAANPDSGTILQIRESETNRVASN